VVEHYSLPAIIADGYRVRSTQGTRFRQWAIARLDEYLVKGFVMDDERLASTRSLGTDYVPGTRRACIHGAGMHKHAVDA
jgi:hypothetical protein